MTLYTFPDPREDMDATLKANASRWTAGTTISTAFPAADIIVPHIQHAWDGTPSDARNREEAVMRLTIWTPKGQIRLGINLATLVRAVLLDSSSSSVWRYTRGAGRLPGVDPDTGLPFVTFTVNAETRPTAVA